MQVNYTNHLLEMKDKNLIVTKMEEDGKIRNIYIEYLITEHRCPKCGCKTSRVHDYRTRTIKHQCSIGYHDFIQYSVLEKFYFFHHRCFSLTRIVGPFFWLAKEQ